MAEVEKKVRKIRRVRHRGRNSQVLIYLGKQLRFFINESDWKVLPMAALIAALVGMVIRKRLFVTMEGSLIGAFALACVAIWNGAFNSIQSICRERAIIKREHRSGMHISSYVAAHMIYQLLLCTAQTGLTMYVLTLVGVPFPQAGPMTGWMVTDVAISMLLISYASDMMSLFISSLSRTTTAAMTIMPFVLIFQLVFSGSIIPLPSWSQALSDFTISNYGIRAIASQSGYNELPMATGWNTINGMRDTEVGGTFTLGQALDTATVAADKLNLRDVQLPIPEDLLSLFGVDIPTVGQALDALHENPPPQEVMDQPHTVKATVGQLLDVIGEEKAKQIIQEKTAEASRNPLYENSKVNIRTNWFVLGCFILFFALITVLNLERIDRDKR